MRKILISGAVFLLVSFNIILFSVYSDSYQLTARRAKDADFLTLFQDIRFGDRKSLKLTLTDGSYRVEIYGVHLDAVPEAQELEFETGFLSFSIFKNNEPGGYYVIYPTSRGYQIAQSKRKDTSLNNRVLGLISQARDAFNIKQFHKLRFQPRSMEILGSYLAPYFYAQALLRCESNLEAFVNTVDNVRAKIKITRGGTEKETEDSIVSGATIENRLITTYPTVDFSGYGLYYQIAKRYPDGVSALADDLRHEVQGLSYNEVQERIAAFIIEQLNDKFEYLDLRKHTETLMNLGNALDIVSTRDFQIPR